MSVKKANKKNIGKLIILWVIIVLLTLILAAAVLLAWALYKTEGPDPTEPTQTEPTQTDTPLVEEIILDTEGFVPVTLDYGMQITDMGKYTGIFMEDGTDALVSGVLMLVVKNTGERAIQYAEITLPNTGATFSLSTLPVGESVVLLEKNRMAYDGKEDASQAVVSNVALFSEPLSLQADKLRLQGLDGVINVTNISGEDIPGDVVIYYKNAAEDLYYGGITYRVRIEGGIKANEVKQVRASHFSGSCKVMFVTTG